jgi:hypothetical protein
LLAEDSHGFYAIGWITGNNSFLFFFTTIIFGNLRFGYAALHILQLIVDDFFELIVKFKAIVAVWDALFLPWSFSVTGFIIIGRILNGVFAGWLVIVGLIKLA